MAYVVDSNFFIQAHRSVYPMDIVPSFWNKVKILAEKGNVISIDKVKDELYKNDDELKAWCQANLPDDFFRKSAPTIASYREVTQWAVSRNNHYLERAIDEFLEADVADAWLVAYAKQENDTLVTHERAQPSRKNKIKIPDVCEHFGISYCNTIEMMRQLGEQF